MFPPRAQWKKISAKALDPDIEEKRINELIYVGYLPNGGCVANKKERTNSVPIYPETMNRGIPSCFHSKVSYDAMVILGVLSLFFMSILGVGVPPQQPEQVYLLPQSNIVPAEATNATANDTSASSNGSNLTQQEQSSGNDTTAASSTGLRIAYPEGWIANDLGNGTVTISTPYKGDLMRFTVNAVNIPPSLQQNLTLDKLVDMNLNGLKQQLSNFTLFESYKTTIPSNENQTAHKIVYTNTNKNPNFPLGFKIMQIFAIKDGQAYTISYVSEESQYLRYLPVIERMIDSISFTNRK